MICSVESIGSIGSDYIQVRLRRPRIGFQVTPGQYVTVTAGDDRAYLAVTNFQESSQWFDLLVAPSTNFVTESLRNAKVGDTFSVSEPHGTGFPAPGRNGYILVAGGSGISAIMSVIDWAACFDVPVKLVYFDRDARFAYSGLLPLVTETCVFWDTITSKRPAHPLAPLGQIETHDWQICQCGPQSLYKELINYMMDMGHDRSVVARNF